MGECMETQIITPFFIVIALTRTLGLEPRTAVLETAMLPITPCSQGSASYLLDNSQLNVWDYKANIMRHISALSIHKIRIRGCNSCNK